jgi:hypothetical protein
LARKRWTASITSSDYEHFTAYGSHFSRPTAKCVRCGRQRSSRNQAALAAHQPIFAGTPYSAQEHGAEKWFLFRVFPALAIEWRNSCTRRRQ